MPRSTTVWAAALVLASFSGSGPMLTTAEAMPAPGPQETQGRPRYYFPRHVKRQIVTNSTAPAAPTSSSAVLSSSSSSEQLESRQFPGRVSSFVESLFGSPPDSSSNLFVSKSEADLTSTVTSIQEIIVTPVPDRTERLSGTGNLRQTPPAAQSSLGSVEQVAPPSSSSNSGSRDGSSNVVSPSPTPTPTPSPLSPEEQPEVVPSSPPSVGSTGASSPPASRSELNNPLLGTIGTLPAIIVPPTSTAPSSGPASSTQPQVVIQSSGPSPSAGLPASSEIVQPSPSTGLPAASSEIVQPSPSSRAASNLLSSLPGDVVGPTGVFPSSAVQPTPTPESPGLSASPAPSDPAASSFLGPFIVPGSSEGLSSTIVQPSPSQGLLGSLLSSVLDGPQATPSPQIGSTGVLPGSIVSPTSGVASPSSDSPLIVLPSSGGIVVGITTALGTGASAPTPTPTPTPSSPLLSSGAIPTSEAALPSSGPLDLPSILSSIVSEVSGVVPTGSAGPTAPTTPSPAPTPSGVLPPVISSLVSDVSSLLSSAIPGLPTSVVPSILSSLVSGSPVPSATAPILPPASSLLSSILSDFSTGSVPSPSAPISTSILSPSETPSIVPSLSPSETPSIVPSLSPSVGVTSSGFIGTPGVTPSASLSPSGSGGSGVLPTPTPSASGSISVPTSEIPTSSGIPSSSTVLPPSSENATTSEVPVTLRPSSSVIDSATIPIPTTPPISSKPTAVQSLKPIGSDSATTIVIPTSIIQESTSNAAPSSTSSGIPSALPRIIAPPGGVPNDVSTDSFMGQVCFKWPLNFPFVAQNDGGKQIFHYLPKAVADGLNISESEVHNMGLRPLDTTQYQGFITTLAYFTIPKDLQTKLQAQMRNPADPFWHNKDQTVNDLTNLINTACPLAAGKVPGDSANPNQAANPAATASGGAGDGGALGGDIGASRPINGSAAGIATGAIVGAIAYGAAMFFVARRYRNKRIARQRSNSVASTGSRMTSGSIPGGAAAWMHGARNGRITPGSRGSLGSSSSQGRSVRTQQISAPVMAENSLGWN